MRKVEKNFWKGKRVVLTGHTGFKGGWMALWLSKLGARVTGIGLPPETPFYEQVQLDNYIDSRFCDIRDQKQLTTILTETAPEIIIHMAAQSLVRKSFDLPVGTFETNVIGTVNLLCASAVIVPAPASVLVVTSDKVYSNRENGLAFTETDPLGGDDPYSASKACAELATNALRNVFGSGPKMATARAGNVIGGGDYAEDRLIPDIIRAWKERTPLAVRSPASVRPWQHVLDSLSGYLSYIEALSQKAFLPHTLNFGPSSTSGISVSEVIAMMETALGCSLSQSAQMTNDSKSEKRVLCLDASLAKTVLNWRPRLPLKDSILWTADWYKEQVRKKYMDRYTLQQIEMYEKLT